VGTTAQEKRKKTKSKVALIFLSSLKSVFSFLITLTPTNVEMIALLPQTGN
jgi:hypothetical protein